MVLERKEGRKMVKERRMDGWKEGGERRMESSRRVCRWGRVGVGVGVVVGCDVRM